MRQCGFSPCHFFSSSSTDLSPFFLNLPTVSAPEVQLQIFLGVYPPEMMISIYHCLLAVAYMQMPSKSLISNADLSPKLQICISFLTGYPIITSLKWNPSGTLPSQTSLNFWHLFSQRCHKGETKETQQFSASVRFKISSRSIYSLPSLSSTPPNVMATKK